MVLAVHVPGLPWRVSAESLTLLKVGELAKRTGKTVRAVHLYEELGLLTPAVRSKGGLPPVLGQGARRIEWIPKLQDSGFSLTEIKVFLRDWEESETAPKAMDRMREIFSDKLRETQETIGGSRGSSRTSTRRSRTWRAAARASRRTCRASAARVAFMVTKAGRPCLQGISK